MVAEARDGGGRYAAAVNFKGSPRRNYWCDGANRSSAVQSGRNYPDICCGGMKPRSDSTVVASAVAGAVAIAFVFTAAPDSAVVDPGQASTVIPQLAELCILLRRASRKTNITGFESVGRYIFGLHGGSVWEVWS